MPGTGSVYKVIVFQQYRQLIAVQNVFHVRLNLAGALFDAGSVTSEFVNTALPGWRGSVTPDILFVAVQAIQIHPLGGDSHTRSIQLFGTSLPSGIWSTYPVVNAGVITWRTGNPSRRGRGRMYICGLPMLPYEWDGIRFGSTARSLLTNIATALMNTYGGNPLNGFEFGVWSRRIAGPTPPYDASAFQQITGFTIQSYIATMGSRRLGHGI